MIKISNVNKTFGNLKALVDVCLNVEEGEMVALIGASGSGKSTLLRNIAGLTLSDRNGGNILFKGQVVQQNGRLSKDIRKARTQIGVIFQQFNLINRLSVTTNVLLGALGRTRLINAIFMAYSKEDKALAQEALKLVGISAKANVRAANLSGGQQQRVAIARTLVQKAKVILADEPIASLDPESSRNIMEILKRLNENQKITIVVTLHQVDYALKYCKRVVAMKNGHIVYNGPTANLTLAMLNRIYGSECEEIFIDKSRQQPEMREAA